MARIKPKSLLQRMGDIVEWLKDEHFDRMNFRELIQDLSKQARCMDEKF